MHALRTAILGAALLALAACDKPDPEPAVGRITDPQLLSLGERVYRANCARCHGGHAEGAANWQRPDAQGRYPAPPLDGSGHAWHHPTAALRGVIREGTVHMGGAMPAWGDKLGEHEIDAVIAWFQSLWPEEVYQAWAEMDARARHEGH